MAQAARKHEDHRAIDPQTRDPVNPTPRNADLFAANEDRRVQERILAETQTRGTGRGALIAALVIGLAAVAYLMFAPAAVETTSPEAAAPAASTESATPAGSTPTPVAPANPG
jgi:hypothetical protein